MKAILVILVVIAAAAAACYFGGLFHMEDPAEQAKRIKAVANGGGGWEQVVDILEPKSYHQINHENMTGRGADQKWNRTDFADLIAKKASKAGWELTYIMSADDQFDVIVTGDGKLNGIFNRPTMKTLTTPGGGLQE